MSDKLVKKMIDNYNDKNLEDLSKHIEKQSQQSTKPVYKMVIEHKGPTKVMVTEGSMKKLAKTVLDL